MKLIEKLRADTKIASYIAVFSWVAMATIILLPQLRSLELALVPGGIFAICALYIKKHGSCPKCEYAIMQIHINKNLNNCPSCGLDLNNEV